jgi:hypothetical protein
MGDRFERRDKAREHNPRDDARGGRSQGRAKEIEESLAELEGDDGTNPPRGRKRGGTPP